MKAMPMPAISTTYECFCEERVAPRITSNPSAYVVNPIRSTANVGVAGACKKRALSA